MSQEEIKNKPNDQIDDKNIEKESDNKSDGDCCCNLFNYKRPTEDDSKKTKRKTCC